MEKPAKFLKATSNSLSLPKDVRTVYRDGGKIIAAGDRIVVREGPDVSFQPLHLYRALLRQCTYLPDPGARSYMHWHVVARYRNNSRISPESQRGTALQKRARKGLSILMRANVGHLKPLERIMLMAYGRIGKRRHELLRVLREPNVPTDNRALEGLSLENLEKKPGLTEKMKALLKSQKAHRKGPSGILPRIKKLQPDIPKMNSWGLPIPQRRIRNMEKEWYADILDRIAPPLPEPEWERLRDLAIGQIDWEGSLPRRTIATSLAEDTTLQYMQSKYDQSKEQHMLTPRLMRRLWAKVFQKCPVMRWDEEETKWQVQWGYSELSKAGKRGRKGFTDSSMFAGVDSRGKVSPGDDSLSFAAEKGPGT